MSLEELLKEAEHSSVWERERHKLIRVAAGVLISVIAVAAGAALLLSFKKPTAVGPQRTPAVKEDQDSEALAHLMRLKKQADDLRHDVGHLQHRTSANRPRSGAPVHIVNYEPGDGFANLNSAKTDLYIPTGAVFQAQLLTPIKTSVEKSFVMAETTNEYRMDMKRRIPRGSRLIGRSHFDPILKGVVVEFGTVVFPNGIESSLNALALSRNALPEIDGLYFSDKMANYGTALAFGFLSGFADAGRTREFGLLGSQPQVSVGNQVLSGLSTASFQVASQIMSDIRNSAIEYVVVPAGEQVFVVLTRRYDIAQGGTK